MLFIDAREIYNQIDRAHRDWTPQQTEFLANIVRLWRGEKPDYDAGSEPLIYEKFSERSLLTFPAYVLSQLSRELSSKAGV